MDAFECGSNVDCRLFVGVEEACAFQNQKWPKPLAAAEHRMAHGFSEARWNFERISSPRGGMEKSCQIRLDLQLCLFEAIIERHRIHAAQFRLDRKVG